MAFNGMEALSRPQASMADPGSDNDNDAIVSCPNCGHSFAPGDMDGDATQLQAGQPDAAGAIPPPPPGQQAQAGGECPECGGKIGPDGKCASCGYSEGNSPMKDSIARYAKSQPARKQGLDQQAVYDLGKRARERMRRPAPYGRV